VDHPTAPATAAEIDKPATSSGPRLQVIDYKQPIRAPPLHRSGLSAPDPELPMPTDASEPNRTACKPYWFAPPEPTLTSTFEPSATHSRNCFSWSAWEEHSVRRGPATALSKVALESRIRTWGRPPGLRTASTPASPCTQPGAGPGGPARIWRFALPAPPRLSSLMGGQEGHCDSQPSRLGNAAVPALPR